MSARPRRGRGFQGVIDSCDENSKSGLRRVVAPSAIALISLLACIPAPSTAADDVALARAKKCMNCHAVAEKLVGPAFKEVAARYANDKQAEDRLAKKIREGGSGAWGVVPMPTNDVTPAEARELAHWVLMQK
jgi:cytochrome c